MRNSFGLPPLFGAEAGISPGHIDECDHRPVPLLGKAQDAQCLAISLRIRLAKIAIDALLGLASLLRPDDGHFPAVEASHAGDDGRVVAEATVTVNLAEVRENAFNVIEEVRPHGMAGQLGPLPRAQLAGDLA